MIDIWLRGEVARAKNDLDALPQKSNLKLLEVSNSMYERIKEHALREAKCPFYQYLYGLYVSGDLRYAVDVLLNDDYSCEYFHKDDKTHAVYLMEWIFAADAVYKRLP